MLKSGAVLTVGAQSVRPGRIRGFPVVSTCGGPWWPLWSLRTGLVLCTVYSLDGSRIVNLHVRNSLSLCFAVLLISIKVGAFPIQFSLNYRTQLLILQITARTTIHFLDHCNKFYKTFIYIDREEARNFDMLSDLDYYLEKFGESRMLLVFQTHHFGLWNHFWTP